jgi:DNA-binding transcriptional MerR regulator/DNA-directed RNA polymerase subunit RPC12/RpoP
MKTHAQRLKEKNILKNKKNPLASPIARDVTSYSKMSLKEVKSMSQYTTGEMAKLCEVSVRTVQFYDTKGLLIPSELTEGGRRLYSEDDLNKLRRICLLKSLGFSLVSIKQIIESEDQANILMLLLEEQKKHIRHEIEERQKQLVSIETMQKNIRDKVILPDNSIHDIEHIMNSKKKLRKVHIAMLLVCLGMTALQIATLAFWIIRGIWWPFCAALPFVILAGIFATRMYYKNTEYICAHCNEQFKPKMKARFFAYHTPKAAKLTCPKCGHKGFCVETTPKE